MAKEKPKEKTLDEIKAKNTDIVDLPMADDMKCRCGGNLLSTNDYYLVEDKETKERWIKFYRFCDNKKCKIRSYYFAQVNMENTIRRNDNEENYIKVKEV